jgi:hypothetical protein
VREEQQERLLSHDKRRGVRHDIVALILQPASTRGQQARLATDNQPKNDVDDTGGGG